MEQKERLMAYLDEQLDEESLARLSCLVEAIEHGWGKATFTLRKGQIVRYKLEKTG